ncbi:unnamed protein product [Rotaria socialis]|nr:unnamed protein product [Rotaria socialis]CAF3327521.1 unnamed protein product [Rotaria socialis]
MAGTIDIGVCGFQWVTCSELVTCKNAKYTCHKPGHICVHHPRCHSSLPVCYPTSMIDQGLCPPITSTNITTTAATSTVTMTTTTKAPIMTTTTKATTSTATMATITSSFPQIVIPNIPTNATWAQNGTTVAGGNGNGSGINQLSKSNGLYVDDDEQTVYVADTWNHRIMEWKWNATSGQVVAGGNGLGSGAHQLSYPVDVLVDKETDNFIICDRCNKRVVRWPRRNGKSGETIISNIFCWSLAMDETGSVYVSDDIRKEVIRYRRGESNGTVVVGPLYGAMITGSCEYASPLSIFVDRDESVYVSQFQYANVIKWAKGEKQGIVVANFGLFFMTHGVVVDQLGTVYVARNGGAIVRCPKDATQESVIIGGNDVGEQSNQLSGPVGLSFDRYGNLYVVDRGNHRVQKFNINANA